MAYFPSDHRPRHFPKGITMEFGSFSSLLLLVGNQTGLRAFRYLSLDACQAAGEVIQNNQQIIARCIAGPKK
jgi:hypothetical protein